MKSFKILGLTALSLSMFACSEPNLSTEEVKNLSIQQFATTACRSVIDANFEQLELMTSCSAQLIQDTFLKELCSYSTGDRSPLVV